ncbi:HRDC domain-containing protein [Leucobacter sp. UT-8R-CII-1-4]|uniref:HRDC domain-containing protein n=1 Tax=Leucobacter sp. UT-8R-CII-1-4 TaxID=3040075 RepID=UPI0024A96ED9|nr:HRDC domain-containing protein [Leucobacter sp. UT-8R-CII-1-4]MDI6024318.1 HRDC domain-containing protein [Leucobacter sp. UT-8R-CII-1-4]
MVDQNELEASWSLVTTADDLKRAADSLAGGTDQVGVDAERASGFRYGSDAYLVQMYRRGSGTFLFDPTLIDDFSVLRDAVAGEEWIFHAASQDLPCLDAIGLMPETLFDTELASRLLGFERVGLGSVVEQLLGIHLNKAHSAADWSTRPLPKDWLEYAALDVALLPDLRDAIAAELDAQGKSDIAAQEFESVRTKQPKPAAEEPWRKLAGGNRLRTPRELALARELWLARDALAREKDVAPGRLVPDASLIVAASMNPRSPGELASNKDFRGRASRSELNRWWKAILKGKTAELPSQRRKPRDAESMPHHRNWPQRYPEAASRLAAAREAIAAEAERQHMPVENLLTPDIMRRLIWEAPSPATPEVIEKRLSELGARPWQCVLTAPILAAVFVDLA